MSHMPDDASLATLRSQLDDLATTLLVSGSDADVVDGFKRFARAAQLCASASVAQSAADILDRLAACTAEGMEDLLHESFSILLEQIDLAAKSANGDGKTAQAALTLSPLAQDPELVGDFITEAREHLGSVENNLLTLEQNPGEVEAVHSIFRGFHTIKGLAGFLEFTPIRDVAHEVETLLDLARNSKLTITATVVDCVLESVDYLKQAIESVEHVLHGGGEQPVRDNAVLIAKIQTLIGGATQATSEAEVVPALASLAEAVSKPVTSAGPQPAAPDLAAGKASVIKEKESASKETVSKAAKNVEASSVRVLTSKLDYLMDMVGEMVITQSLIRHNPALGGIQNSKLLADLSQLTRITGEVQRTTMGMRMITIGQVFQRSSRLIRDLSRRAGKQVQLDISGEDTELDKTIAEELTDPLLHMVRNACDHGIEEPAARVAAGKDPTARVRLAAYHQGGQIVIEIADDGRGLDREKIVAKAVQKGLIESGAHLSEQDVFNLIFEPGFSTAAQITDISGRGVGMDVVRKNIQKLRGRIEIQSKLGHGTTFLLKLPLTLAIIEGLVVGVGPHRYIVPIYGVRELISPKADTISKVHGRSEMAVVRDHVLPVLRLSRRFNVAPKSEDPCRGLLVVTETQDQVFCLLVDEVLGKQEVVIKTLGDTLKNIPGIAGGAILGDGRVGLILDLEGVFRG